MNGINPLAATPGNHPSPANGRVPELQNGDHLTRDEFERRYRAMPQVKKAELIEGVVFMPSPVNQEYHSLQHTALVTWLGVYWAATPGVRPGDNATVRLDLDNEPQPDALLYVEPRCGGQVRLADGYLVGAPELVAEVAASSVSIDRNAKQKVYLRNGVREYLIWRVLDNELDWFILRESRFQALTPAPDGVLHSETFPGLWLDAEALLRLDVTRVLAVLQQGLVSPEHAELVSQLQTRAGGAPEVVDRTSGG